MSVLLDSDTRELTYTADDDFNGLDFFTFTVTDNGTSHDGSDGSLTSEEATIYLRVNGVNDNPVANSQIASIDEEEILIFNLSALANDNIDNNQTFDNEQTLEYFIDTDPLNGVLEINIDENTITYIPNNDFVCAKKKTNKNRVDSARSAAKNRICSQRRYFFVHKNS